MTDSSYTRSGDDREPELVGSYRTNSFFELYNNQRCIKNELSSRKARAENSLNRSEEDEDESNLNDEDLNFDDLDDFGAEPRDLTNEINSEDSEPDEDEELDKFDGNDNQENLAEENLNGIAIGQRFRRQRSNSRTIHEDELSVSMKQYAKSMPVAIPNDWKPFNTNRDRKSRNGVGRSVPVSIESIEAIGNAL